MSGRVGFMVDELTGGGVFCEYFGFPKPTYIPPAAPHPLIIQSTTLYRIFSTLITLKTVLKHVVGHYTNKRQWFVK
jgi:hypothetical protein